MQVIAYWLVRTAMFLALYAALWALKWFDIFAVLVAFVAAWALSYVALPTMRQAAARQMDGWLSKGHKGVDADADAEDRDVELAASAVVAPAASDVKDAPKAKAKAAKKA